MMYTDIQTLYQYYLQHPIICTDSRHISAGCIFFALKGSNFDGNAYAEEALAQGAAYAVVDNEELEPHRQLLLVDDSLLALQELAALHRATLSKPVLAITGTNGKTTTKELVAAVLTSEYKVLYTEGNMNNHIGLPLTLLRLREEHDFAIVEMGASKVGDIAELCAIAQPNYGVITNIGEAHLEGFGSIVGVERTKAELYQWLKKTDGKVFRREDDARLSRLSEGLPAVTYGQSVGATIQAELFPANEGMYLSFVWQAPIISVGKQEQRTQLVGDYNLDNALVAISVGLFFGLEAEKINQAIEAYKPNNSRSQYIQTERNELILDAYNANPSSMRAALVNFFEHIDSSRERVLILGDMNELGDRATEAHMSLYELLCTRYKGRYDRVYFCGSIWFALLRNKSEHCFADTQTLLQTLNTDAIRGKLILIKGSNSYQLQTLVNVL